LKRILWIVVPLFLVGLGAGWWLAKRPSITPEVTGKIEVLPLVPAAATEEQGGIDWTSPAEVQRYLATLGSEAELTRFAAVVAEREGRIGVVRYLLEVIQQTTDQAKEAFYLSFLKSWLQQNFDQQSTSEQLAIFEELVWHLPAETSFLYTLGQLQLDAGMTSAGLQTLAQITNDPILGHDARLLMNQVEAGVSPVASLSIPLQRHGGQYLIDATIDDGATVTLLIDTGAAVTVIKPEVLLTLGYAGRDGRVRQFATAGGLVDAPLIQINQLAIADAVVGDLMVGALPLLLPDGIDGLLGMNFLGLYSFSVDQNTAILSLTDRPAD